MEKRFKIKFDDIILKRLKKISSNQELKNYFSKMFDRIEEFGPEAGKLLDSRLHLYEMKSIRPPLRLYYRHHIVTNDIILFEFEMKTNPKKQQNTIKRIKRRIIDLES